MNIVQTEPQNELLRRLHKAREYVDDCFADSLDLERIAQEAYLSPFHFQRLFRRAFNLTPHQYMTYRRLERAKELLVYTDLAISEICLIVGFQSLGSFSTLFSRETMLSPLQYRNCFGKRRHFYFLYPKRKASFPFCFYAMYAPLKVNTR